MQINPQSTQFGATVTNVDLPNLSDDSFREIEQLWWKYAVLLFPDQFLSEKEQFAFSRRFGLLECGLQRSNTPSIARIRNIDKDGNLIPEDHLTRRFNIGNSVWHTDSSYKRVAAKASLLSAYVVPKKGGETEWADMRQACDRLEPGMREWLDDKIAEHHYAFSHAWHGGLDVMKPTDLANLPPVYHPVIQKHPDSDRDVLFVGRHATRILGEDKFSSRTLLRRLTHDGTNLGNTWKHRWSPGDLVIWDNRCVLHRARYAPRDQKRSMLRTTVAGDALVNEWATTAA